MESLTLGTTLKVIAMLVIGAPLLAFLLQERLIFYRQPLSDAERQDIQLRLPKGQSVFAQAADGTLCLVAMRDSIIPAEHAKVLYEAWAGPKRWVPLEEAGHNTVDAHPNYWRSINAFLSERSS